MKYSGGFPLADLSLAITKDEQREMTHCPLA